MAKLTQEEKIQRAREKQRENNRKMQERSRAKQKAKQSDPVWQEEQRARQRKSQERAQKKLRDKRNDPEYQKQQREKEERKRELAAQKQRDKWEDPAYQEEMRQKGLQAVVAKSKKDKIANNHKLANSSSTTGQGNLKSKGTLGRTPTADEKRMADKLGELPCICCSVLKDRGLVNFDDSYDSQIKYVSLHHIDGRTKPKAHFKQLPLCAYHHQVDIEPELRDHPQYKYLVPVHATLGSWGGKKAFNELFVSEYLLLELCYELIGEHDFFKSELS